MNSSFRLIASASALAALMSSPSLAQQRGAGPGRPKTAADTARAMRLYVSKSPEDLPTGNAQREMAARLKTDSIFAARSVGFMDFKIVSYKSDIDTMIIPAYVFSPLKSKGTHGSAGMVWVHGFVHGNFDEKFLPFVKEAVARGYVIVAPQYRGSTGYGEPFRDAIDYGGKEVDDAESAYGYIKANLPNVDPDRVGIMGWSHGGFITAHILFRDNQPFKCGAPMVPVTNLIFRLSYKGPGYAKDYAAEPGIQGLPFENPEEYLKRSPVFHVANLKVPLLINVATNDSDVNFVEDQQMVYTLRALKPDLADTKIYIDPPPGWEGWGHTFSQRINLQTLERDDSPEQIDAWNRIWAFFERNLHPDR